MPGRLRLLAEKKAKRNLFSDENRRNKWLAENYETYSMALMIAVAVFDAMPYTWVMRAADALYESFENKRDKEEKRYGITEILSQFGAVICRGELNTYTGITPVDIVRLDKKTLRETILKYVTEQKDCIVMQFCGWELTRIEEV